MARVMEGERGWQERWRVGGDGKSDGGWEGMARVMEGERGWQE
jgi:hypothetical protein